LEDAAGGGDNAFGAPVGVLVRRFNQSVAAFLDEYFSVPGLARDAVNLAAAQRRQMDRMEHAPDPFDVFFQVQPRLAQLNLNRPVADAVEVADSNPFAFQILQRLDMRRADPN